MFDLRHLTKLCILFRHTLKTSNNFSRCLKKCLSWRKKQLPPKFTHSAAAALGVGVCCRLLVRSIWKCSESHVSELLPSPFTVFHYFMDTTSSIAFGDPLETSARIIFTASGPDLVPTQGGGFLVNVR